jgi:signal transduction histidine kinase
MASTRVRFTLSYVGIAMGAVFAFAISLYIARRSLADDQVANQSTRVADRLIEKLRFYESAGVILTVIDSSELTGRSPRVTRALGDLLEPEPGIFFIYGRVGTGGAEVPLYQSTLLRLLPAADRDRILKTGERPHFEELAKVPVSGDTVNQRYIGIVSRQPVGGIVSNLTRIVAGTPTEDVEISSQLLIGTIFVLIPFVLIGAGAVAWLMADRAFAPLHDLTVQLEAITDGRSLHRRLPPDNDNDEIGRLTTTINAMLSRLELSFAALRRFTADASHELKTPLAVLRADVERAMHPRTTKEDRMVALEESLQEVTRMSDLVDSLLTLARADEGRFELAHEDIAIEPLLRDVYETATILGETAGLSISMPSISDAIVRGERTRLRQLLLNLITNAIKYTPRGGKVEIASVLKPPGEVAITVRDTGIGISATDLPHIFDRFWRADRARSRAAERSGFGLGLAISQYIAQAHGGTLVAQSRLGRGTLFTLLLPVASAPQSLLEQGDSNSDFTDS